MRIEDIAQAAFEAYLKLNYKCEFGTVDDSYRCPDDGDDAKEKEGESRHKGESKAKISDVAYATTSDVSKFITGRDTIKTGLAAYVTHYTPDEYKEMGAKLYLSDDGVSGYAVKPDGEFISVFSNEKGRGLSLCKSAIANGANHLDCLGTKLKRLYEKAGFEVTEEYPWDDQYAPKDWDYEKYKRPNLYVMKLGGKKGE